MKYFVYYIKSGSYIISNLKYDNNDELFCVEIDNETEIKLIENNLVFDIETKKFIDNTDKNLKETENNKIQSIKRKFLAETDWKVMRHIREKTLGIETSISEEDFIKLEMSRFKVSKSL